MSGMTETNSGLGRTTTLTLGLITILCILLIGMAGFVKYKLDRSELALASPDISAVPESETYEKVSIALGYGGYLGAAQSLIATHDHNNLIEMKRSLQVAQDFIEHMPERTSASSRHDLQNIVSLFTASMTKATQSTENNQVTFNNTDLLPAQMALPILESRLQNAATSQKTAAQNEVRLWSMALTLISWISLIVSAAMAAGIYLTLQKRQSVPLRALAQSIDNLAKGDLQTPIWGLERRDAIGELARSVDLARYHFSQMPDLSLISDQGPVRMKFEGGGRSLFEALMHNIRADAEQIHGQTASLTSTVADQQRLLADLSDKLSGALSQIQDHTRTGSESIREVTIGLNDATGQLARLVPYMQQRAHNMAEVTRMAGLQVTETLTGLLQTGQNLRRTTEESHTLVQKLASESGDVGERIFAAVNLLQAGSKMMNEATESTQSRLSTVIDTLGHGQEELRQIIDSANKKLQTTAAVEQSLATLASRTENSATRMDGMIANMGERHEGLSTQITQATERMNALAGSFDATHKSLTDAVEMVSRDGSQLGAMLGEIKTNNEQLSAILEQNNSKNSEASQQLLERTQTLSTQIEAHLNQQSTAVTTLNSAIETFEREKEKLQKTNVQLVSTSDHLAGTISQMGDKFAAQAEAAFGKTADVAMQNATKLAGMAHNIEDAVQRLNMLGQLTGTLSTVAGQLGQIVPSFTAPNEIESLVRGINDKWQTAVIQIEDTRKEMAQLMLRQRDLLEARLAELSNKISGGATDSQQTAVLQEIVSVLNALNTQLIHLEHDDKLARFNERS